MKTQNNALLTDILLDDTEVFHERMGGYESLPLESRIDCYRKEVTDAESSILDLFDRVLEGDECRLVQSESDMQYISHFLGMRYYALSKMFAIHCSDAEVRRMEQQNARLLDLTRETYRKSSDVFRLLTDSPSCREGSPEIEGSLRFTTDGESGIPAFEDDDFYGSDFRRMIPIISLIDEELEGDLPIISCRPDRNDCPLDDGTTWAEGWLRHPKLDHIIMCYATHVIVTHKDYSVPDYLRMESFSIDVETGMHFQTSADKKLP